MKIRVGDQIEIGENRATVVALSATTVALREMDSGITKRR